MAEAQKLAVEWAAHGEAWNKGKELFMIAAQFQYEGDKEWATVKAINDRIVAFEAEAYRCSCEGDNCFYKSGEMRTTAGFEEAGTFWAESKALILEACRLRETLSLDKANRWWKAARQLRLLVSFLQESAKLNFQAAVFDEYGDIRIDWIPCGGSIDCWIAGLGTEVPNIEGELYKMKK